MVLYRSLTVGLLGACLYFLLKLSMYAPEPYRESVAAQSASPVTVIDVAPGLDIRLVPSLVHLAPGERITAVADRPVANDLAAGAAIVEQFIEDGTARYIDITVDSAAGARRVLVLMH
ncbi:MAG TPA: hypothetical protein VFQ53_17625 [Kofleriaceae bacterium]|nr:hypothetical protein [Kofleriaceae bacterium]